MQIKRNLVSRMAVFCFAAVIAAFAHAQQTEQYPSRPVRIIIGFAPGGSTDAVARFYAQRMSEVLKVPVLIDNKPGGGQVIAIKSVTTSRPDGYTLYLGSGSAFSQGPGVRKDLPYDPLKDLSLIGLVATAPGVIVVTPSLPVNSVPDLIKYSNENPSKLNYGSSGVGSASHLQSEYLMSVTGIKMTHIPYKADADIMRELSQSSVHMGLAPIQGAMGFLSNGRVRALAVTGTRRLKSLPNVPSLSEVGIKGLDGIDPYTFYGLAGPTGLPTDVIVKLNGSINKVSQNPEFIAHVRERLFAEPAVSTPDSFRKYIEDDLQKWQEFGKVVKLTE
jgi:tripartite-type tricarboxylate transporter receptor subunit TctC